MSGARPTVASVLKTLAKDRLVAIGREFRVAIPPAATKDEQAGALAAGGHLGFDDLLRWLGRDELKAACRAHGLPDDGRARALLADRLLQARGAVGADSIPPLAPPRSGDPYTPIKGCIAQVRRRQYLVEDVVPPPEPGQQTRVDLVCLDDDSQGRRLSVLWELELGAKVLQPEAHTAAPASASKYAIDSRVTKVVRDVAPRFENRLFLSATPHNGHSNSFSALLELLDPQRFTRGVPVKGLEELQPVMVRRLKSDLRALGVDEFPRRDVVQIDLSHEAGSWRQRYGHLRDGKLVHDGQPAVVGQGRAPELDLSRMLEEYTALMRPKKGRGQLVFINLQKRLLSSIEAFTRTLRLHEKSVGEGKAHTVLQLGLDEAGEGDEYGLDDEAQEDAAAADDAASSAEVQSPEGRARQLLSDMVKLAEEYRGAPDAKTLALLDWIRKNLCPGVQVGGGDGGVWSDRRVLIFTEYGDTKRYLWQILSTAVQGTDDADARISQFHGGMSDEQREEVQRAFNGDPNEYPARILIATDAAREGVNLQGHCADLFHFDVPWNPARMEQRNGRIDRTLQPEREVRCHYFFYPQRAEDQVLRTLVGKVETIQHELGSLSTVVMGRYAEILDDGIGKQTVLRMEKAEELAGKRETVREELELQRNDLAVLKAEIDDAGGILNRSRQTMEFAPELLRDALNVGFELSGAEALTALPPTEDAAAAFRLPEMSASWAPTLDTLRPPRGRDEAFWEWRKRRPQPVVFHPPEGLVVSVPVLVDAQCMHRHAPSFQGGFLEVCPPVDSSGPPATDGPAAPRRIANVGEFLERVLSWTPDLYDAGEALPEDLSLYVPEGKQTIRPTLALRGEGFHAKDAKNAKDAKGNWGAWPRRGRGSTRRRRSSTGCSC